MATYRGKKLVLGHKSVAAGPLEGWPLVRGK